MNAVRPPVPGAIGAPHGLGVAQAFARERAIDCTLEKVTIPRPSEITMMLEPREAVREAWPAVVTLIKQEIGAVVRMGATEAQLDLPHVAKLLADGEWDTNQAVGLKQLVAPVKRRPHRLLTG